MNEYGAQRREPVNRQLVVKFDLKYNMDEPIAVVENIDGDILSVITGDNAEDLYDYLLGEEAY